MKILYVASNQKTAQFPFLTDYQNDCLLIGLKELFGDDVVDVNKRFHLYSDYPEADAKAEEQRRKDEIAAEQRKTEELRLIEEANLR